MTCRYCNLFNVRSLPHVGCLSLSWFSSFFFFFHRVYIRLQLFAFRHGQGGKVYFALVVHRNLTARWKGDRDSLIRSMAEGSRYQPSRMKWWAATSWLLFQPINLYPIAVYSSLLKQEDFPLVHLWLII